MAAIEKLVYRKKTFQVLFYIDAVCVSFFSLDLIIKFLTWPDRINFFKELLNWCDMISVGPFYIQVNKF